MIRISINQNRADVRINMMYAETQLIRAKKKAKRFHPRNRKLWLHLANAHAELTRAWGRLKMERP
jgi:hypothetical protein